MKPEATEPDRRHADLDELFAAEQEPPRKRAPRIIAIPVSGRGPADWFPDEDASSRPHPPAPPSARHRTAPGPRPAVREDPERSGAGGTTSSAPPPPTHSQAKRAPARSPEPGPASGLGAAASTRPSRTPRQRPAAPPPVAGSAPAAHPRAEPWDLAVGRDPALEWDQELIDHGIEVPRLRRRRRWFSIAAAGIVVIGLGAAGAVSTGVVRVEPTVALQESQVAYVLGTVERWWSAVRPAWLAPGPASIDPPAERPAGTTGEPPAPPAAMAEARPGALRPEIDAEEGEPVIPAAADGPAGEGGARTSATTGRTPEPKPLPGKPEPPPPARVPAAVTTASAEPAPTVSTAVPPTTAEPASRVSPPASPTLSSLSLPDGTPVTAPPPARVEPRITGEGGAPGPMARSAAEATTPSTAPAPPPAPAPTTVETGAGERAVRAALSRYEAAYSSLNADAAAAVYPEVDRRALARAFGALQAQDVRLRQCDIQLAETNARASCTGTASWTPRVGGGRQQQDRRWDFALRQVAGAWTIDSVRIR